MAREKLVPWLHLWTAAVADDQCEGSATDQKEGSEGCLYLNCSGPDYPDLGS